MTREKIEEYFSSEEKLKFKLAELWEQALNKLDESVGEFPYPSNVVLKGGIYTHMPYKQIARTIRQATEDRTLLRAVEEADNYQPFRVALSTRQSEKADRIIEEKSLIIIFNTKWDYDMPDGITHMKEAICQAAYADHKLASVGTKLTSYPHEGLDFPTIPHTT